MPPIDTPRLRLVPATPAALRAELVGRDALAAVLGVDVPESWPPELYDDAAVRWTLAALEEGRARDDFTLHYVIERGALGSSPVARNGFGRGFSYSHGIFGAARQYLEPLVGPLDYRFRITDSEPAGALCAVPGRVACRSGRSHRFDCAALPRAELRPSRSKSYG